MNQVGLGQVEEFFQPNPLWWVKKNPTNPVHVNQVGSGLTFFLITIIIIIKLNIRTTLQIKTNL